MKNFAQIITLAAFAFFFSAQSMTAQELNAKPSAEATGCNASAEFDQSTQEITLRMSCPERDRVRIMVYDSAGRIFFQDKRDIDENGVEINISLAGLDAGIYYLRAKGSKISYGTRFKKK